MASGERIPLNPSRYNLNQLNQQLKASRRSHQILKRKADLIKRRLCQIRNETGKAAMKCECLFRGGMIALAEAQYVNRHFKQIVLQAGARASLTVSTTFEQFAGVTFERYHPRKAAQESFLHLGLSCGAQKIRRVREVFDDLIELAIEMASMSAAKVKLEEAFKTTARRLNSLEYVKIPKYALAMKKKKNRY